MTTEPTEKTPVNGLAIASLVLGIGTIALALLTEAVWALCAGPLAVITGIIALLQKRKRSRAGTVAAIIGILLGLAPFVIGVVFMLMVVFNR